MFLIKTDKNGNLQWSKTYGTVENEGCSSAQQTPDGGYILIGSIDTAFSGTSNGIYLVKTDKNGVLLWSKKYRGTCDEDAFSIQQTTDGGYIISGTTCSFGAGKSDIFLIKTDSIGDTLWTRTYGGVDEEGGAFVKQTLDGGYIVGGD